MSPVSPLSSSRIFSEPPLSCDLPGPVLSGDDCVRVSFFCLSWGRLRAQGPENPGTRGEAEDLPADILHLEAVAWGRRVWVQRAAGLLTPGLEGKSFLRPFFYGGSFQTDGHFSALESYKPRL